MKIIRAATVPQSLDTFCKGVLRELSEKYEVIALSAPGVELRAIAEREGVRTISVPMERHISLVKDLVSLCRLVRVFHREKPVMVHSMTPKAGLLCMIAAWLTRVPVRVHTFTGLVFPTSTGMQRQLLMFTDSLTCRCATHVIPEGEGVRNDLLNYGITTKPLQVLGFGNVRGIDLSYYCRRSEIMARAAELREEATFTFLYVGRMVRDKGVNELCEAFSHLPASNVKARLLLVGPYEEGLDPISLASHDLISSHPRINYVGEKKNDELLAFYAAADCFVLPSYREGFPNTVLEAGAMGLPCIVTDINGSREIIEEGVNGLIIPPKNVEALVGAMTRMMTDTELCRSMGANARDIIICRYEQGYVRRCLYEFYNTVLPS